MARVFKGRVVFTKMDKTAVVEVSRFKQHPLYGKKFRVSQKYLVHDPDNQAKVGQMLSITESRPLSKRKSWLISHGQEPGAKAKEPDS